MSKVDTVINKLKKSYDESFSDVDTTGQIERVLLESPRLNYIFGGGFAIGRMYEFYGPESGGKSTLATYIGGQIQEKFRRPIVVYVDFEYSFDKKYAVRLGLKTDKENLIFLRPTSGEDAFEILKELVKDLPVGLIVFDSISATPSKAQVEDTFRACVDPGTLVDFRVVS